MRELHARAEREAADATDALRAAHARELDAAQVWGAQVWGGCMVWEGVRVCGGHARSRLCCNGTHASRHACLRSWSGFQRRRHCPILASP
eukprot:251537-Chlamydomonas_euryale.AAC.1